MFFNLQLDLKKITKEQVARYVSDLYQQERHYYFGQLALITLILYRI